MSRSFKIAIALLGCVAAVIAYFLLVEFSKHHDHAKMSKRMATYTLRQIADGARSYWDQHGSFPANIDYTPVLGTCCKSDDPPYCPARAEQWMEPTWTALDVRVDDKNAYSYAYDTKPGDTGPTFTARARGDLDCDDMLATYEIYGHVDGDGTLQVGPVVRTYELE